MALRMIRPALKSRRGAVVVAPKAADPYYLSSGWKAKRERVFERDRFMCVVPGCVGAAKVAEHVVSRRNGGSDDESNLCSLCRPHDNHFKENPDGTRRNVEEWRRIFGEWRPVGARRERDG